VLFLVIGFLFANGFSLMAHVKAWPELWENTSVGGAAVGLALNVADASLWPRWLMLFGLALTTTAAWVAVDAAWFARKESDQYKIWAADFAWRLSSVGLVWFAVTGLWYTFSWSGEAQSAMWGWPAIPLTILTALAPGLPWLLLFRGRQAGGSISRPMAALVGLAQFGVLGVNAISRQVVQNVDVSQHAKVLSQPEQVEWSPLLVFLVVFVAGLGVVAWMIAQVRKASPAEPSS
jgi:hypothetical protein